MPSDRPVANVTSTRNLVRTSAKITLIKLITSIAAMLAVILVAYRFGVSSDTDALFLGRILPLLVATQLSRAASITMVPILSKQLASVDPSRIHGQFTFLLIMMGGILVGVVALYNLLAESLIGLVATGLSVESRALAVEITHILSAVILLLGFSAVFEAYLNAHQRFLLAETISVVYPLGTVFGVLALSGPLGIHGVPIGTLAGSFAMVLLMAAAVRRAGGLRWTHSWNGQRAVLTRAGRQIAPVLWGGGAGQLSNVIARALAGTLGAGEVSVFSYGYRICSSAPFFVGLAIGKVLLPQLARQAGPEDHAQFRVTVTAFLRVMWLLFVPVSLLLIALGEPLIAAFLAHGAFEYDDVLRTASVVVCFAPAITVTGVNIVMMRAFFSLEQSRIIFRSATVFLIVAVGASIGLVGALGIEGLALAYTFALTVQMLFVTSVLQRQVGRFLGAPQLVFALKVVGAAVIAGLLARAPTLAVASPYGFADAALLSLSGSLIYVLVYLASLWVLGVEEGCALPRAVFGRRLRFHRREE